ncbi:hypothetical protein AVEN_51545-1 [Araneus ventricosus]|uniref:Uncharacterized protein n=1 Tax=Araneus ventricosus TaxID=182803 RepID=A0A4Y2P5G2_ARAVE|nr:hypothetical protein AVEN_51545-1 [Araneus ventricosus]
MSEINLEEYLTADDNLMVFVGVTEDILSEIRDEMENDDNDDTDPSQSLLTSQEAFQSVQAQRVFFQAFHPQMMMQNLLVETSKK